MIDLIKHKKEITTVILVIVLLISIIGCIIFYNRNHVFTNEVENTNFDGTFSGVYDASGWSAKLVRFEYKEALSVLNDDAL